MNEYIVKITQTATDLHPYEKAGTTRSYYIGKGEVVSTTIKTFLYVYEGWKSKGWATRYIKQASEFNNDCSNPYWDFTYEIVEIK